MGKKSFENSDEPAGKIFERMLQLRGAWQEANENIRKSGEVMPWNTEAIRNWFEFLVGLQDEELHQLSAKICRQNNSSKDEEYQKMLELRKEARRFLGNDKIGRAFLESIAALGLTDKIRQDYLKNIHEPNSHESDGEFMDFMRKNPLPENLNLPTDEPHIKRGEN